MGREATVPCQWAEESGQCKVLLESPDLVVRGALRRRFPIADLADVSVKDDDLVFSAGTDRVTLRLGATLAQRWARAITTPAASLASKLGISPESRLLLIGEIDSKELDTAIAEAASTDGKDANLIVALVWNREDLELALRQIIHRSSKGPLWIVYPKGTGSSCGESLVRTTLRDRGFVDTKVASVSKVLTALRFVRRDP